MVVVLPFSRRYIDMETEPRLVLVIGSEGVRLIRMVASCREDEEESISLYLKLRPIFHLIDEELER